MDTKYKSFLKFCHITYKFDKKFKIKGNCEYFGLYYNDYYIIILTKFTFEIDYGDHVVNNEIEWPNKIKIKTWKNIFY